MTAQATEVFDAVLARYAHTFAFAAVFLPRPVRNGVAVLYTFCRAMDDLGDEVPAAVGGPALDAWAAWLRERATCGSIWAPGTLPPALNVVPEHLASALDATITTFDLPIVHLQELVAGIRLDAVRTRIRTQTELNAFCYAVAGTVGRTMCHLLGTTSPKALAYAERLGIAMQLTNILRDVGED